MSIAFVPLYIKYLGIEAYGIIGLFVLLTAWLALLDLGMTPTMNREMARFTAGMHTPESIRDLLRSLEVLAAILALLIVVAVVLVAQGVATDWVQLEELSAETVAQAITIMGFVIAVRFMEGIYRGSILGLQRHVLYNAVQMIAATLRGAGAVAVLALWSPSLSAFFLWQGLVSFLSLTALVTTTYLLLPQTQRMARVSATALRGVWRFAGGMMGITFLALLLTQVDKIVLSTLLPLAEYGVYALAAAVAAILFTLTGPVSTAFFPRLSQLHAAGDTDRLAHTFHQGAQLVSVITGSAAIFLIVFSEPLLRLWTQDMELARRAAPLVSLLALGNLLNGLMWIPYQTQVAHGWTGLAMRINIGAVLVIVPAILLVAPIHGAIGAAWIWAALNTFYVLVGAQLMFRRILCAEKWRWYAQDILYPILAGGAMALPARLLFPGSENVPLQALALVSAGCFVLAASGMAAGQVRVAFAGIANSTMSLRGWFQ